MEKLKQMDPNDLAKIELDAKGQASLQGKTLPDGKLQKMLAARLAENPQLVVVLRPAPQTPYKDMTRVLALVQEADAERVVILPSSECSRATSRRGADPSARAQASAPAPRSW